MPGVVFHVPTVESATTVLRNATNLRMQKDAALIEVVAHGEGLALLLATAPTSTDVAQLLGDGVAFSACANTLRSQGLGETDLTPGVAIVSSGVARVAELQWAGYAYLRP